MVDTDVLLLFESGVALLPPGLSAPTIAALASRSNSSPVRPCSARGAGSTPLRVNRSANKAKQRSAPSATCNYQKYISAK